MTKREEITHCIEEYIEKYVADEIILSFKEIRKWPIVDRICEDKDPANICNAMDAVKKYRFEYVTGIQGSTTYTLKYIRV